MDEKAKIARAFFRLNICFHAVAVAGFDGNCLGVPSSTDADSRGRIYSRKMCRWRYSPIVLGEYPLCPARDTGEFTSLVNA